MILPGSQPGLTRVLSLHIGRPSSSIELTTFKQTGFREEKARHHNIKELPEAFGRMQEIVLLRQDIQAEHRQPNRQLKIALLQGDITRLESKGNALQSDELKVVRRYKKRT